jgi:hypothetical protein
VLIVLSSIRLVIGTYFDEDALPLTNPAMNSVFVYADYLFNGLFLCECLLKIVRNGFFVASTSYLRDSWSILDFIIVVSSVIDFAVSGVNLKILRVGSA